VLDSGGNVLYTIHEDESKYWKIKDTMTDAHKQIVATAKQWKGVKLEAWTFLDFMDYARTHKNPAFVYPNKFRFLSSARDVLEDAAAMYDIPVLLLAGVAYIEFGGAPMFVDPAAHVARTYHLLNDKDPNLTSFGNMSIQVRRALETLGYENATKKQTSDVIKALKDPVQNIYIAAKHLSDIIALRFDGKSADELTDEEIQMAAAMYNIGPNTALDTAMASDYGQRVMQNRWWILYAIES
jgi:hypothetical protein